MTDILPTSYDGVKYAEYTAQTEYILGLIEDTGGVVATDAPSCNTSAGINAFVVDPEEILAVNNTAYGYGALQADSDSAGGGHDNTAIGYKALNMNTKGELNTAVGSGALENNTGLQADNNTAVGYNSLQTNAGLYGGNTAVGSNSAQKNLGNYNTTVGYNTVSLSHCSSDNITAVGTNALYSLATGTGTTAIGSNALYSLTTGTGCTAVGNNALYFLPTGTGCTAVGNNALQSLSNGRCCTAVGSNALKLLKQGDSNTESVGHVAIGANALENYIFSLNAVYGDGSNSNTAIGYNSMKNMTDGFDNTAVGYNTLANYSNPASGGNVAIGNYALTNVTAGATPSFSNIIGIGLESGTMIKDATNSILIGNSSAGTMISGTGCVVIGYQADVSNSTPDNQIVIGRAVKGISDNSVTIGAGSSYIYATFTSGSWNISSDIRLKTNIQPDTLGLDFITDLKPVTYQWRPSYDIPKELTDFYSEENTRDTTTIIHGLIAQDIKKSLDKVGNKTFNGWSSGKDGVQHISKEMFVIPLIKAVKELTARVEDLETKLSSMI